MPRLYRERRAGVRKNSATGHRDWDRENQPSPDSTELVAGRPSPIGMGEGEKVALGRDTEIGTGTAHAIRFPGGDCTSDIWS